MSTSSDKQSQEFGTLLPVGGGDPIPLFKEKLLVGRRESCDVVLRFGNVSAHHCELTLEGGYWFVKDLNSRNGTRINGYRVTKKRMDPGDTLSVAKHEYKADYSPDALGAEGPPPDVDVMDEIMSHSLLEGAGLDRKGRQHADGRVGRAPRPESPSAAEPTADAELDLEADADTHAEVDAEAAADDDTDTVADEPSAEDEVDDYRLAPAEDDPADDDSTKA